MKTEIRSLTGIRGVAACSVMAYHLAQNPAFAGFRTPLFSRGYLCVDLFFVLSGFILAYIYSDDFVPQGSWGQYGTFLLNRLARVFPLNFVVTLVFAFRMLVNVSESTAYHLTLSDIAANLSMIQGWGFGFHALAGNSWSVSTELLAYLTLPVLLRVACSKAWPLLAAIAIGALILIACSGLGVEGIMDVVQRNSFLPAVRCVAGFSLGLVAFRLNRLDFITRTLSSIYALPSVLLLLAVLFLIPRSDLVVIFTFPALILVLYYDEGWSEKLFGNATVYHLGVISYSIYLWHPLLRDVAGRVLDIAHKHGIARFDIVFVVLAFGATWLLSVLSYRFVEMPGRDMLRHLIRLGRGTSLSKIAMPSAEGPSDT